MSNPPTPSPPSTLPTGRMRWLWLAVLAALGLWLVVLLVSGDEQKTPFEAAEGKIKPFDPSVAEAFSKRPPLKVSLPQRRFPALPEQRKSE